VGWLYLLHFDRAYIHARHYLGWSLWPYDRVESHRRGHGSRLMRALRLAGIDFWLALLWEGSRHDERRWKRQKNAPRFCPHCCLHGGLFGTDPVPRRKVVRCDESSQLVGSAGCDRGDR
jgi:hypothetical protein